MHRTNAHGRQLIKLAEGLRLRAYRCPAGKWTIGYGDTGPNVRPGLTITEAEAEERLARRLAEEFEPGVEQLLTVEVTGNQFSALVSFAYNTGLQALAESTLLRKLNAGDYAGAAAEFPRWNKKRDEAGRMVPVPGLTTRRAAERELFCTPDDIPGDGPSDIAGEGEPA
ncbi:MAG: lysozyme [Desulfovibrio sp.]